MKIVSNFHDYYDSVRKLDSDSMHVYDRITHNHVLPPTKCELFGYTDYYPGMNMCSTIRYDMFMLGFCGQTYVGMSIRRENSNKVSVSHLYGDMDYFLDIMEKNRIELYGNRYKPRRDVFGRYYKERFSTYFQSSNIAVADNFFMKYKVPVFVLSEYDDGKPPFNRQLLILNPCLNKYEFFRVKNVYDAYQDISTYVGNVLVDDKNKVWPISDKLKAQSKGFNKYSFRKDKET